MNVNQMGRPLNRIMWYFVDGLAWLILSWMIQALVLASRHESYTLLANAQKEMLKYILVLYTLSFFFFSQIILYLVIT